MRDEEEGRSEGERRGGVVGRGGIAGRAGGGVLNLCMAVVVWPQTLASLLCRDGARRVFTNQADIGCTKR